MVVKILTLSGLSLWFLTFIAFAQTNPNLHNEFRFTEHLISRGSHKEALYLLHELVPISDGQGDTINYYTGWVFYGLKDLEASSEFLLKVSPGSQWYHKSMFFSSYNNCYLGKTAISAKILRELDIDISPQISAMMNFQIAGIALLDRDLKHFAELSSKFSGQLSAMEQEEKNLQKYYETINSYRAKSPWLAATLSVIMPGMGKLYAGKTGEGIAGLLYVGAFSAMALEFYHRSGFLHPGFIISAFFATIFYTGNIMGSYAAANRTNNEFNYEINQKILFDMHIPLRRLFP